MRVTRLATVSVCLLLLVPITAAAWNSDPALNDLLLRSMDDGLPSSRQMTDGNGGIITIAIDEDLAGGNGYLTFNRTDASGTRLHGETGVRFVQLPDNYDGDLYAISDGNGGAFCVVRARPALEPYPRYRMYRVDSSGVLTSPAGGQLIAMQRDGNTQSKLDLMADGAGGAILVFESDIGGVEGQDIVAQRVNGALDLLWATAGVTLCGAATDQLNPRLAPDGAGGAIVAWQDARNGADQIYGTRVDAVGTIDGPADGSYIAGSGLVDVFFPNIVTDGYGGALIAYTNAGNSDVYIARFDADGDVRFNYAVTDDPEPQIVADLISDGNGGAFILWSDSTNQFYPLLYVQYLSPQGAPRWVASGLRVSTSTMGQQFGKLALDGSGGVIAAWTDTRNGLYDVYAQRINSVGERKWDFSGIPVSLAGGSQYRDALVPTGDGAWYVAFEDTRGPGGRAVYVQRLDADGYTGDPRPVIDAVDDFPQDQGGVLLVQWTASDRDTPDQELIAEYLVLRRLAGAAARRASVDVERFVAQTGLALEEAQQLLAAGWEYVDAVEALQLPAYAYSAPSYGDQTPSSSPVTEYLVIARAAPDGALFESTPVGGTSTDNLAPGAPEDPLALRLGSIAEVRWQPPQQAVPDFLEYRVYRGSSPSFVVDGSSLVGTSDNLAFDEPNPGAGDWYYRVTAADVHGNEGLPSLVAQLDVVTSAGEVPRFARSRIGGVTPNPFNPRTEIHLELAQPEHVRLVVFDLRGRRVATLVDERMPPGPHTVSWEGVGDDHVAVASGSYFLRLETDSAEDVRRVTLVK